MNWINLKEFLQYDDREYKVFMPNEIFNDFKPLHTKGSGHVAFAYSFYYLNCWLYRYAKYGSISIDSKKIKEILGYSPIYKKNDYIIKKNGFLDEIGYTFTSTDYPLIWELDELNNLEFTLVSDIDNDTAKFIRNTKGKNSKIKVPSKGIWRTKESEDDNVEDGTFHDISSTHMINFELFIKCMENEELGCIGFYIYSYLKYRIQWFEEFNSSVERISNEIGIKKTSTNTYINRLLEFKLIDYKVNECVKVDGEYKRKANTYTMNIK